MLILLIIFLNIQSPYFLTSGNITNILGQVTEIGIIAIPMTYVIISGNMDLSAGSIMGLAAVSLGMFHVVMGVNIWISVLLALLVGAVCGAINGYLIAKYRIEAIVVTIGTMVMLRGVVQVLTEGRPVSGYPEAFTYLGQGRILGIPVSFIIFIFLFLVAYYIMKQTRIGKYIYALGNNEEAVHYSGISVFKVRLITLITSGVFSALAGILLVSRLTSVESTTGEGIELSVITAVLIGGTHIFGGRGSLIGTIIGVMIIGTLTNGLNLIGVSSLLQMVVLGILILIAVGVQKTEK